jgi:hypothetical protein
MQRMRIQSSDMPGDRVSVPANRGSDTITGADLTARHVLSGQWILQVQAQKRNNPLTVRPEQSLASRDRPHTVRSTVHCWDSGRLRCAGHPNIVEERYLTAHQHHGAMGSIMVREAPLTGNHRTGLTTCTESSLTISILSLQPLGKYPSDEVGKRTGRTASSTDPRPRRVRLTFLAHS